MTKSTYSLCLGGGAARGISHIPILEVLDEFGVRPAKISGTSIGAIMGAGYAAGLSGSEIREATLQIFAKRTKTLSLLWKLRGKRVLPKSFIAEFDPLAVLEVFIGDLVPKSFDDLVTPLTVIASDFYGWNEAVFSSGDLREAVAASIAIPVIFSPVIINGNAMVDGGLTNPVPFDHLDPNTKIIAVDVNGGPRRSAESSRNKKLKKNSAEGEMPSIRETTFGSAQLIMQSLLTEKLKRIQPDLLLRPKIESYGVLDFLKTKEILEVTDLEKDDFRRKIGKLLEA